MREHTQALVALVDFVEGLWPHLVGAAATLAALAASAHAVLNKRDSRAAVAWVGLIWLVPIVGAALYLSLGVNRIRRRARSMRGAPRQNVGTASEVAASVAALLRAHDGARLERLVGFVDRVVHHPLLAGNRVELYVGGDEAYPPMLEAIERAERSVGLTTYIFDNDPAGRRFADALEAATRRGVDVRVLIDGVGARYAWPPMPAVLHRRGVRCARFLPTVVPWRFPYMNLRCHRKILVVDGEVGFTGGMNIREGHQLSLAPSHPIVDAHARVTGPVVKQLVDAFRDDWRFAAHEPVEGEAWYPRLSPAGESFARGIPDGPDEDFEELRMTLLGALAVADRRVCILTPYFIPDTALVSALNVAAMRGVQIDILLPAHNNLALVQWASTAILWQVVQRGCRVWLTPPPFEHTKLMVVDGLWTLLGSANWDPRSLRLSFEFNVEVYDRALASRVEALADARIASAHPVTLEELDGRRLPRRLRDGVARLLSPYL